MLKKANKKSEITEGRRSHIDKIMEKDFRLGPKYKREEIESMMKDKNFATMYADLDKYKKSSIDSK
jgi:hypothetical protein